MFEPKNKIINFIFLLITFIAAGSAGCSRFSGQKKFVNFSVISKLPLRPSDNVYLTGNNKTLGNWNARGVKLERRNDSTWSKTLSFNEGEHLEFKFTLGSWNSEALKTDGWILDNSLLTVAEDTAVTMIIDNWGKYLQHRNVKPDLLQGSYGSIKLVNNWKYHEGDNPEWAKPEFNDSLWQTASSNFSTDDFMGINWRNTGWFRTRLHVDSALWNKTFGMKVTQLGASEIYYNGRLLKSYGKAGTSQPGYTPVNNKNWDEFTFDAKADQVIAVKYTNLDAAVERNQGFDPGFSILLMDLKSAFNSTDALRPHTIHQMVFTLIPLVLSFLHLFLYFFYRRQKQNLYYAICLLGFAGLTYFNYERFMLDDPGMIVFLQRLNVISAATSIFFGMLTLFSVSYGSLPKRWRVYLGIYIAISISGFLNISPGVTSYFIFSQFGLTLIEGVYAGVKKDKIKQRGTWIILPGFIVMSIFIILQLLLDFSIADLLGIQQVYVYGMLAFVISMSLYLSYNFSYINKGLEEQLVKVKELSDRAIEQERIQASLEIERRVMEAENMRKTKELESARDLQISLLPKNVPQPGNLEIACYMKTAAEVGGDYYDFHLSEDGTLTAVIGDATGHGLKAGNMVILAKGLFNTLAREGDLIEIMHSLNRSIKQMNLYMLTMCMSLVRIKDYSLEYVSAGMPPMQIYRKETGEVEELLLKGMPLGAFSDFPYQKMTASLCKGDVILIMSDGLPEMFNGQKETFGMDRAVEAFKAVSDKPAQEIIDHICNASRHWANDTPLADDMTIMVIKVK
ncbi:MAG TPA: SpoIIE family protein phosphatase [Ignavibacteriales bacterium]|nr:SpoIIE family protein phosphatase [Ignavibacteriales bacterium]